DDSAHSGFEQSCYGSLSAGKLFNLEAPTTLVEAFQTAIHYRPETTFARRQNSLVKACARGSLKTKRCQPTPFNGSHLAISGDPNLTRLRPEQEGFSSGGTITGRFKGLPVTQTEKKPIGVHQPDVIVLVSGNTLDSAASGPAFGKQHR